MLLRVLASLLILAGPLAVARAQPAEPATLFLGSALVGTPAEVRKRMTPLARYLSAATGIDVQFRPAPNMQTAIAELANGVTSIAYLTPVAYVLARRKPGTQALAAPLTQGMPSFRLVLAVKQASTLHSAADLKGKTLAFVDERALLQQAVLASAGVRLGDLAGYADLKQLDNIAKAVLNEDFDAGILTESVYQAYAPRGLRALYISPPLPSFVVAVHSGLPQATANKLRAVLLALRLDDTEQRAVLQALDKGYDGFAEIDDKDYDAVRQMIAPFAPR